MIPDSQTNYLYLADTLPKKHLDFYNRFKILLSDCGIEFSLLPGTKDIWAVDYMPIQIDENNFIRFVYNPGYLQSKKWLRTVSDTDNICKTINLKVHKSSIVLDGGNVVKTTDKVIMSSRIFIENPAVPEKQLIRQLQDIFRVDKLIFIPTHPDDFTGHADGMVRFLDDKTVLINDYSREKPDFQYNFRMALHNAGLEWIPIPYNPDNNKKTEQANGIYINYLQMEGVIIVPIFNIKEDEATIKLFESKFSNLVIKTIESNEIAQHGGILNCITWNIKTNQKFPL
jgi:agmatine deiminase